MPKFIAGDDVLLLEIPGLDPIEIPVHIVAGTPSKLTMHVSDALLSLGDSFTGDLSVSDAW